MKYGIFVLLSVVCFMGCGEEKKSPKMSAQAKGEVVSSIFPLGDVVQNILGDTENRYLLPPRANPHSYEPSPNDMKKLKGVKIAILVGGGLDDWVEKLLKNQSHNQVKVVRLVSKLDKSRIFPIRQGHGHHKVDGSGETVDPHVWLDPVLMKEIVEIVSRELTKVFPKKSLEISRNTKSYLQKLNELDRECEKGIKGLKERKYISVHGAFYYFARRYGLEEKAVIEPFPGKEPSVQWMKELILEAKEHKVTTVWAEPQLSNKSAVLLAHELGGKVIVLDPMGDPSHREKDSYVKLMKYNLNKLVGN